MCGGFNPRYNRTCGLSAAANVPISQLLLLLQKKPIGAVGILNVTLLQLRAKAVAMVTEF